MNESKISVRYSKALFESALGSKTVDTVFSDMTLISEICRIPEVKEVLESPVIVPSKKQKILIVLFEKNVSPLTLSLISLLVKNGREAYLPGVARVFRDETLKYKGITPAFLSTAVPADSETREKIKALISKIFGTKVELSETTDESLIGGFILKVNDSYIDASVKSKLRKIRRTLTVNADKDNE